MEKKIMDEQALIAAKDEIALENFIQANYRFIGTSAYQACHHYVSNSDDEWSIALISFTDAVKTYDSTKGHFSSYARLLIKRSLIDYYRKENQHNLELSVTPDTFDGQPLDDSEYNPTKWEVTEKTASTPDQSLTDEIQAANALLQEFGFSFFDLSASSPKTRKTKENCKIAVRYILDHPILMDEMTQTHQLSLKIIQKNTHLPRKLLDKHRRYIIAAVIILSGEYPLLSEYMSFIRKEGT